MAQQDDKVKATINDPEFLKLSEEDQTAVLQHLYGDMNSDTPAAAPVDPATAPVAGPEGIVKKLARGGALGLASGLGIEESTEPSQVVTGTLGNWAKGIWNAGKEILSPPEQNADPRKGYTGRGWEKVLMGPAGPILGDIARGLEGAGGESIKGIKDSDPETFAHGLGSLITQVYSITQMGKGKPKGISERSRLAKTVQATSAGANEIKDLRAAMPEIVKQSQAAGINTVGELRDTVKTAKRLTDDRFNIGLAPIANTQVIPNDIARRIRNLESPDMAKTREGRAEIKYLKRRAAEYDGRQWTYGELNAKRVTENKAVRTYYKKDTMAQHASALDLEISKAIRDGASDIVYQAWDRANPGQGAADLKKTQGALWATENHLDGIVDELDAKQLEHEGKGFVGRLGAHGYISMHNPVPHAWLTGVKSAVSRGPEVSANAKIRQAFSGPSLPRRLAINAAPVAALLGRQPMTPPPE
jgi:hypothetical protein